MPDRKMNARIASYNDGFSARNILAIDIFRWNLRLGFAIAPRDMRDLRRQRRPRLRPPDLSARIRADIGLAPEAPSCHDLALQHLMRRW